MSVQLSVSLGGHAYRPEPDPRAAKLQSALAAASRTAFYGRRLKNVSGRPLGTPYPFEILRNLPPVTLQTFIENRDQFTNARARPAAARPESVHLVPNGWRGRLGFAIEAIAGPQADLARLAARIHAGEPAPGRGARRLLVYTKLGEPLLDSTLRDRLWQAFELPVFEQLHGFDGELLASECEAHEGMHLETESAIFEALDGALVVTSLLGLRHPVLRLRTGLAGAIERRTCPCGEAVSSFLPVARSKPLASVRQVSAAAGIAAASTPK